MSERIRMLEIRLAVRIVRFDLTSDTTDDLHCQLVFHDEGSIKC